ncbi:hypothetical protein GQ53DRAFT_761096 [Thozetella sp. PMI_491]|nr:hypothetical protein GQ53DRAFT_761096 [Thozetella sp. PMI_491]
MEIHRHRHQQYNFEVISHLNLQLFASNYLNLMTRMTKLGAQLTGHFGSVAGHAAASPTIASGREVPRQVYSAKYGPSYGISASITLGIVVFGTVGFLLSRALYMLENRRRRRKISGWTEEQFEEEQTNLGRLGHVKKYFIFGYW